MGAMAQSNVELVQRVMDLLNRAGADPEAGRELVELMASDVRIDMSRRIFNPHVYEGHAGLRQLGREVGEVWDDFRIEPERFVEKGDRVVVIELRRGRGKGSGVETEQRSGVLWTLRDGQVAAMETDMSPEDALAAIGES
jgi:ketosteroid isomerase-like protein